MNIVRLPILRPGEQPILAGRLSGKRAFVRALDQLAPMTARAIVALDFTGAEIVTSSFLAELAVPLRDHLRLGDHPAYVVAANLSEAVREEFEDFLRRSGDAMLVCTLDEQGTISGVQLVGHLDQKLQETFDLIVEKGAASAAELHAEHNAEPSIGATAWNNRLTLLAGKSLLVETAQGRAKKYRPVLEVS